MIGQSINSVFISSLTLVLVLAYSFFVHWSIAVALLVLAPILGLLVSSLGRRIKQVQTTIFGETNALAGSTTESLRNIELIKSLGLETQEIDRLNATNQKILDLELAKVKTVRMLMFFQGTAINFFRALFLLQMLILAYFKLITLGEFFSLLFYSFAIFSPLGEIGNVVTKYSETRASLENVEKILAQEPAPRNPGGAVPDGIESLEFAGVTYRHPGAKDAALTDVSLRRALGGERGLRRPLRRGQEHAHQAAARPVPARRRADPVQRGRFGGDQLRPPAHARRVRAAVHRALRRHHPRQPEVRPPGGHRRRVHREPGGGAAAGAPGAVAAGPGHAHRRGRPEALRRRTAAAGHRPRAAAKARPPRSSTRPPAPWTRRRKRRSRAPSTASSARGPAS